jgi:hypothetical protein
VTNIAAFLKSGVADVGGKTYKVEVHEAMKTGLGKGLSFTVQGTPLKGEGEGEGTVTLQLYGSSDMCLHDFVCFEPIFSTARPF